MPRWSKRAERLPDAPPALLRAAINLWSPPRVRPAEPGMAQALLNRIVAVLSFDSFASPQLAMGMRSAGSESRHLLFSAMGRDIDLRILPADDRFVVAGQILGPDETGSVELASQGSDAAPGTPAVTALDALGEFRLESVAGGTYVMTLRVGGDEIVLPPIDLKKTRE